MNPRRSACGLLIAVLAAFVVQAAAQPPEDGDEIPFDREVPEGECPIDVDIHLPAAQDPAQPLVDEAWDKTEGAWTLRNDDMDAATDQIVQSRLVNRTDLNAAEGTPDLAVAGAVAGENDLVAVDLHNPARRANLFFNAYSMAQEAGAGQVATNPNNRAPILMPARRVAVWRSPDRTGPVTLPLPVGGPVDRVWVEGLGAGRYRLVLFELTQGGLPEAKKVKAGEQGSPHGRTTAGVITLRPPPGAAIGCFSHVRLTVAVADIHQTDRRQHLYDVLWGGRPVFDGRLWPGGGTWTWGRDPAFAGAWLPGKVNGVNISPDGTAPAGQSVIHPAHGAFEPAVQAVGQRVVGSPLYARHVRLTYKVEDVTLVRDEPVTLMAPDHITFTPLGALAGGVGQPQWGTTYAFDLQARYTLFDQHDRRLVGRGPLSAYHRQYGARLQAYEALGGGANAAETGDQVTWTYVSPINPARTFTVPIGTRQRSNAIPQDGTLTAGQFTDSFRLSINNSQRGILQQDIRQRPALAASRVFAVSQDVVILLSNGAAQYDVRVARGQVLEILAPRAPATPAGQFGGMGFRIILGGAGGTVPDTGNPDRVASDHNPPAPPP